MAYPRPCERCGKEIPMERIEAMPETRVCVQCSRDIGGEFTLRVVPENVGKTGSLKKNYASFGVERQRKRIERKKE